MGERRHGLEQERRGVGGAPDQRRLGLQKRALSRAQPAVEDEDGLGMADQAKRVDQRDRAEEVRLAGDAVEGRTREHVRVVSPGLGGHQR